MVNSNLDQKLFRIRFQIERFGSRSPRYKFIQLSSNFFVKLYFLVKIPSVPEVIYRNDVNLEMTAENEEMVTRRYNH